MTASTLERFAFDGRELRTVLVDGEPWFVAADAAEILGYRMASDATRMLDQDERGTHPVRTPSGEQLMTVVSESGLYGLILRSRLDSGRRMTRPPLSTAAGFALGALISAALWAVIILGVLLVRAAT